jgi:hypothetical protein
MQIKLYYRINRLSPSFAFYKFQKSLMPKVTFYLSARMRTPLLSALPAKSSKREPLLIMSKLVTKSAMSSVAGSAKMEML